MARPSLPALLVVLAFPSLASAKGAALHELQVVFNDTDSALKVGPRAIELLKEKGYDLTAKPIYGELRNKNAARVALKIDVLKPASCFVSATAEELPAGKGIWTWQTRNDKAKCEAQVQEAIEAFFAKFPPAKK